MGSAAPSCPLCDAELVLSGDEEPGDEVFCPYCGAPVRLPRHPDREEATLDEEF
jgi:uncharacterized Zn-finger protein